MNTGEVRATHIDYRHCQATLHQNLILRQYLLILVADMVIRLIVHIFFIFIRDGSACTTLRRVPGPSGKFVDEWMEFYFKKETEKEFYLRNRQVKKILPS